MDNQIYKEILKDRDIKRQKKIDEAIIKKNKLYADYPELEEIERKINMVALNTTRNIVASDELTRQVEAENMKLKLEKLEKEKEKVLKKIGVSKEDLEPKFDCKICNDTGIVRNGNTTSFCTCFKQDILNYTYKQSNILKLDEENFKTFDNCYYSNKKDKEKYGIEKSPLENIELIKKLSIEFCNNIKSEKQKNLLFTGNTGLGKTFLSNCIAKEVIEKGLNVVYQTSPILMDQILDYKFSYDKTQEQKEKYNKIFNVDLLIIDDLGTETMNNNKFTELFNIINTRLLNNKKMVISTNLTLNDLYNRYDERILSRLIGNFTICKFIGDDIRLKKKRIK